MKKILALVCLAIMLVACSGNKKDSSKTLPPPVDDTSLVSYKFKILGLQEGAMADSVFHLHFKLSGIDKMVISEQDCTVVFTVEPEELNKKDLEEAIEDLGGVILKN